jgi:mannose-1-phosphate guanylyltransferase
MAGGIGSRFWPVSRTEFPKQFIDFFGVGKTLIQSTFERFLKICPAENIFIVTNESYVDIIKTQLPSISDNQILAEPLMRNTAPCISYGVMKIAELNEDAVIVVAPSDHTVANLDAFIDAIERCYEAAAASDSLITMGIKPSRPDTGYGYIQFEEEVLPSDENLKKVKIFTEKPNLDLAKSFLQSGDFLWNAGIFIWSAKALQSALKQHLPEMFELFSKGKPMYNTPKEVKFIKDAYQLCTNISIDFGLMEKAENVYVLPADFGWSDLGTWASVYEMSKRDNLGNALTPANQIMIYDSTNCLINVSEDKLVVLQGLHDFIVVESNNTLLICPRSEEQNVKNMVSDVRAKYNGKYN